MVQNNATVAVQYLRPTQEIGAIALDIYVSKNKRPLYLIVYQLNTTGAIPQKLSNYKCRRGFEACIWHLCSNNPMVDKQGLNTIQPEKSGHNTPVSRRFPELWHLVQLPRCKNTEDVFFANNFKIKKQTVCPFIILIRESGLDKHGFQMVFFFVGALHCFQLQRVPSIARMVFFPLPQGTVTILT